MLAVAGAAMGLSGAAPVLAVGGAAMPDWALVGAAPVLAVPVMVGAPLAASAMACKQHTCLVISHFAEIMRRMQCRTAFEAGRHAWLISDVGYEMLMKPPLLL